MVYGDKYKDELLECFTEEGERMHPRYRSEVCADGSRRWHSVAAVWVLNRDGMFLCTQRAPFVEANPNKWQTYAGGHVKAGSSFIKTAISELYEELGIKMGPENLQLIDKGKKEKSMHFFELYAFLFDGGLKDLNFRDGEVIESKWYEFDAYQKDKEKFPEKWCNGLTKENYLKITEWIKTQN